MPDRPDYRTLRENTPFAWSVAAFHESLVKLTGTPLREVFLSPPACIEVYRKGRPLARELFGPDVALPGVSTPPISYGHANTLGCKLVFPEGGEVGHEPVYASLAEGVEALKKDVDFAASGLAGFYLDFHRQLQQAFPGEPVEFSYGDEGPLTSAYVVRGDGFFYDLMDQPQAMRQFLGLLTDSIVRFRHFRLGVTGQPPISPDSAGLCDDIAAMVPPAQFPELVLPFWERYFQGLTTGRRVAHVEDLSRDHLRYLEEIGLSHYDPSISAKLNPKTIAAGCRVPFGWRLGSFHYRGLSAQDVRDFVFQAAADGASRVFTLIEGCMCDRDHVPKVHAFIDSAREAQRMLEAGASRGDVGRCVSQSGRRKFWEHWTK